MLEDLEKMSGELVASDHYDADKVASSVFFSELSFDTKQVHKRWGLIAKGCPMDLMKDWMRERPEIEILRSYKNILDLKKKRIPYRQI